MTDLFNLPDQAALDQIAQDLKLDALHLNELHITMRHALADLEGFFRTRMDRRERARRAAQLRAVHAGLEALIAALGSDDEAMADVNASLPFNARQAIAAQLDPDLIATVCDGRPDDPFGRQTAGLQHGARLLGTQLRVIKAPMDAWLANQTPDPGGPEPDYVRNYVISALAKACGDILDRRATATANGLFARLVTAVFHACNLDDTGLEKRIERQLSMLRNSYP
jgi:hypothetical protein